MAKSRKGFAKQNGRKKARLARKDTKMKKILKGRKDVKVKLTEQQLAQMQQEAKIDAPSDVENSDNEWTELGSCTTGGGLKITSDQKKIKPKTRRQVENKSKKTARGEAYTQRFNHQIRQAMTKRSKLRRARREEG